MRTEVASTLEGYVRDVSGRLIVFVEPKTSPCPDEECGREHYWLQHGVLRRCSGQPGALILAG